MKAIDNIQFTHREIDIIACLLSGRGTKAISTLLSIAPRTVETHIRNIMRKMGCNSQDGIREFIEKSGSFNLIKTHYKDLLIELICQERLADISKLAAEEVRTFKLISNLLNSDQTPSTFRLAQHLKRVGIIFEYEDIKIYNKIDILKHNIESGDKKLLYLVSQELIDQPQSSLSKLYPLFTLATNQPVFVIFLFFEKPSNAEVLTEVCKFPFVDFSMKENYYFSLFELLTKLLPRQCLDKIRTEFQKQYESIHGNLESAQTNKHTYPHLVSTRKNILPSALMRIMKNQKVMMAGIFTVCISMLGARFLFQDSFVGKVIINQDKDQPFPPIRSDLPIPSDKTLLKRGMLLNEIERAFKKSSDIPVIALVGIGGAGKTIIARQYAQHQKSNIIWELNAESFESLIDSFEHLAHALSQTDLERTKFERLQEARNPKERIENIISFIKEKLKIHKNWLLIFDNVENFADIQKYFPSDPAVWGTGQVIVTTRDANIQNNDHIDITIQVGELNESEKLSLFLSVLYNEALQTMTPYQQIEIVEFLKHLPPFPLDISIAAYYLKSTDISFERYLEYLQKNREDFMTAQETVLKDVSEYTKNRYSIISLSLQKIMGIHKDFGDLLLFISLLESQKIPRNLLNNYKSDIVVDSFIYNLNKYSLITRETHKSPLCESSNFSIHHNTRNDMFMYFIKLLKPNQYRSQLKIIASFIDKYMTDLAKHDDILNMRQLISHVEALLKHKELLEDSIIGDLANNLALLYVYLGDYKKAEGLYEKSLAICKNCHSEDHVKTATVKRGLGLVFRGLGEYERSKTLLQQALTTFKAHYGDDNRETIETVLHLGNTYRASRDYKKAKGLLEQGLGFYEKKDGKNHINVAWILVHLGLTYRRLGDYEHSIQYLERGFNIYRKLYGTDNIYTAWALIHLSGVYGKLGQHDKALKNLYQTLGVVRKHYGDKHIETAIILINLGNVHQRLGSYNEALKCFKEGYELYRDQYGKDHIETCWSAIHLGTIYRYLGDVIQAKNLVEPNVEVYIKRYGNSHLSSGWAILNLAGVYKAMGNYEKAEQLYEEGLRIYSQHFGKDHTDTAHVLRNLGEVQISLGHLDNALPLLTRALSINQATQNIEMCFTLEALADLYLKHSLKAVSEQKNIDSAKFNNIALSYIEQAHKAVETSFSKESQHYQRIRGKMTNLQNMKSNKSVHSVTVE